MSKRLLLDAGNTRLKWAVVEGGLWREQGGAAYTDLPGLAPVLGLLPQQLLRGVVANDPDVLERHGLTDCIECGCCGYVCPSAIPLTARFRAARAEARVRESARWRADDLRDRYGRHGQRLEAASEAERRAFENARDRARGQGG